MSKMILQIFVFMFILSCSQQTAPPLNLENEQKLLDIYKSSLFFLIKIGG